jgi:hypothetical protein
MALLVALALGCKKDKDKDDKDGKDNKGGVEYKTPEEAFEAFKTAAKDGDHKAYLNCLTPESQDEAVVGMLGVVVWMRSTMEGDKTGEAKKKMKPVSDVLEKHGLTEEDLKPQPPAKAGEEGHMKAMKGLLPKIKDKPAFYADLIAALEEGEKKGQKKGDPGMGEATLEGLKIDGDKATAKIGTGKNAEPIVFRKIGNGWKIEVLAKTPQAEKPLP